MNSRRSVLGYGLPCNITSGPGSTRRHNAGYYVYAVVPVVPATRRDIRQIIRDKLVSISAPVHIGWVWQNSGFPCVTITVVRSRAFISLNGPLESRVAHIQIDTWGKQIGEVIEISHEISDLLQMWTDHLSDARIDKCRILNESDRSESPSDGSDQWIYRLSQDFEVQYSQ